MSDLVSLTDIQNARRRIQSMVHLTPCVHAENLSHMAGCEIYLKLENQQITGSFKDRGSLNKILTLGEAEKAAGVITASAGNHAQGVAHAARVIGIKAVIVMPEVTPLAKIRGTQELGAEILLRGASYDEAYQEAMALQRARGYTFIHAFDDPTVIAGQGTIGLEILEQVPELDVVVVPVGGGGLISGIATAVRERRPDTRVVGVEVERVPAMKTSVAAGKVKPVPSAKTLADGISVATVGKHTLPIVSRYVSELVTVGEEAVANAIMQLLEREKTLVEGAGAVGCAALCEGLIPNTEGRKVVIVISGGNIDMTSLARILERGLELDGRLARLKVVVPDRPGSIAELANLIAAQHANILQISQNRHASEVGIGEAEVDFTLETRGRSHVAEIMEAMADRGYEVR